MASPSESESAPPATLASTLIVPMALQAFVVSDDFADSEYQVAPIIQPDFSALRQKDGEISHDLMDQLDTSFWRLQARYNARFVDLTTGEQRRNRSGIYLSWCLPRVYRTGITATDSAIQTQEGRDAYEDTRVRSGYSRTQKDEGAVHFRPAPDRWIVVRSAENGMDSKCWLVDSSYLRPIGDQEFLDSPATDLELVASPGMDLDPRFDTQSQLLMGRSVPLTKESLSDNLDKEKPHKRPFNAFEVSHEFFADYQPHNMGVFSFFDSLDSKNDGVLDYVVIGFHSDEHDDPLAVFDSLLTTADSKSPLTNAELIAALSLAVDRSAADGATFLDSSAGTEGRTLTHGLLRLVPWSRHSSNLNVPSIILQRMMYEHQPVAVGMHTLDALGAFLHVSLSSDDSAAASVQSMLDRLIMLIARKDDVGSQRKAADETAVYGWIAQSQGTVWQLPKPDDKEKSVVAPSDKQLKLLNTLNQLQQRMDTIERQRDRLVQRLFGCWWNAIGLRRLPPNVHQARRCHVKAQAEQVAAKMASLDEVQGKVRDAFVEAKVNLVNEVGSRSLLATASQAFGRHHDPTILIAGAKSGWPTGFSDSLEVRLASEVAPVIPGKDYHLAEGVPLPAKISEPAGALLREFFESEATARTWKPNPYIGMENMNNTQGWFPLFMEWEVEYYHIPFDKWTLEVDKTSGDWRYVIPDDVNLAASLATADAVDRRLVGGRTAIAPEAAATLKTRIEQLFSRSMDESIKDERDDILKKVAGLEYFTSPLGGFTDHLLTLRRGHLPRPSSIDAEVQEALGLSAGQLKILEDTAHEVAPYGATTALPPGYAEFCPFKPVTHGQFRFTKLILVDRFGQVVSAIKPGHNGEDGSALYPCVSPSMACNPLSGTSDAYYPNSAIKADSKSNVCQFVQIPPRINQPARLNSRFLVPLPEKVSQNDTRKAAGDWDNPIWAWLIVNYQNMSIQVYNGTGEFVLEALLDETSIVRFSHGPDDGHTAQPKGRLSALLDEMANYDFSRAMFDMLSNASDNIQLADSGHDAMLPAAFGRPFCIADVGVSIELAAPPFADESLLTAPTEVRKYELGLLDYEFPVVLGNSTASFDGLVGTFAASGSIGSIQSAYLQESESVTEGDGVATSLKIRPYFCEGETECLSASHDAQLAQSCVSAILDPSCPLHVYSGGLFPLAELAFPQWPVDKAVRNMHAFFAVGPTLVPAIPHTDEMHIETPGIPMMGGGAEPGGRGAVQMPVGGTSTEAWRWLHPRLNGDVIQWDPVAIRAVDKTLKVEAAAESGIIEGYILIQAGMSEKSEKAPS